MNALRIFCLCCAFQLCSFSAMAAPADLISGDPQAVPIQGMVTMLDLGAKSCIPCKMMSPVIEALSQQFSGKAAVVFIDVWKNPNEAKKFGIRSIPTQIFYDKNGKEYSRHEGFLEQSAIVDVFKQLGVE